MNEVIEVNMQAQQLFGWAGQLATIGWLILVFGPRRFKIVILIPQYMIPITLGLLYSGLALSNFFISDGGYNSIASVRALFTNDFMLLAGWVHYLAFDLFIGAWIALNADRLGISRFLQAPILVATFMFGPVGLVLYMGMKAIFVGQPSQNSKYDTATKGDLEHA